MKTPQKKTEQPFEKFYKQKKSKHSLKQFEEEDLSFGSKKKKEKPIEKEEPEVTFSKELKNKWATKPFKPQDSKGKKGGAKEKTFGHKKEERQQHSKGFKKYFDKEEERPDKVFASGGSREKLGTPEYHRKGNKEQTHFEEMPLNKFIAHCDVCSRRDAAILVKEGKVKVDGELITEPGFKVTAQNIITLSGKKLILQEKKIYILLNKPKGYITTTDDPKKRRTVMDLFRNEIEERIYPVGRLDRNTTGLLILTNDGDLSQKLAHPSNEIKKIYQVTLNKEVSEEDFEKIKNGLVLEDGLAPVNELAYLKSKNEVGIEIHIGRNRIVRRIFESLGYVVEKLDRVMYASLTKKNIPRGHWRFLTKQEVINLKHFKA